LSLLFESNEIQLTQLNKKRLKGVWEMGNSSQSHGVSRAIWDYTLHSA